MPATAARPDGDVPSPETLLQEYKELRERFQRTTNALASAAHDLKTPLSILNGYVELLHSEKLGPLSDRQREVLRDMQASGKRLQQFIQDFLTYSALETGGLRMQFEPGNINDCLSDVCRLWSNRFQEKGLALYFLANDKLPVFPFDSPKLERVISNLLENSFKFTPAERHSVAACRAAHVGAPGRGSALDRRAPPPECNSSQLREGQRCPIPGRESPRSSTWKSSTIFSAFPARKRKKAWDWVSPSPAAWCRAWEAKSGLRVTPAQAANFLS